MPARPTSARQRLRNRRSLGRRLEVCRQPQRVRLERGASDPLSQLRFAANSTVWGINVERFIQRNNEYDWLELVAKAENGLASRMAHLTGIDALDSGVHLEVLPYTAARTEMNVHLRYGVDIGSVAFDPQQALYTIDPDGRGPATPFSLGNPDFNYKSLIAKAVFRWEWRPGSALYLAWTQKRFDDRYPEDFNLSRDTRLLFQAPADDVFLVKFAYWFSR